MKHNSEKRKKIPVSRKIYLRLFVDYFANHTKKADSTIKFIIKLRMSFIYLVILQEILFLDFGLIFLDSYLL